MDLRDACKPHVPLEPLVDSKHIEQQAAQQLAHAVQAAFGDQQLATLKQVVLEGNSRAGAVVPVRE